MGMCVIWALYRRVHTHDDDSAPSRPCARLRSLMFGYGHYECGGGVFQAAIRLVMEGW